MKLTESEFDKAFSDKDLNGAIDTPRPKHWIVRIILKVA